MKKDLKKILERGLAPTANETDKQEMLSLFHEQQNEFLLKSELLKHLSGIENEQMSEERLDKLFNRLWTLIQQKKAPTGKKTRYLQAAIGIAASLLIGLFGGELLDADKEKTEPVYFEAHSPRGSISEVTLPDGTNIYLNADSKIRYSMEGESGGREVYLDGEAWFDVANLENSKFTVFTPYYTIDVTGTHFNVKAYESDKDVVTTLEEGKVHINSGERSRIAETITLEPGEQLILRKDTNKLSLQKVNTNWYSSWKDNKLIFVNMSLRDLEVLLERKYGVEIELKNDSLLNLHFDGTIKNESIIEILDILQKTLPINYQISSQKIEITTK